MLDLGDIMEVKSASCMVELVQLSVTKAQICALLAWLALHQLND